MSKLLEKTQILGTTKIFSNEDVLRNQDIEFLAMSGLTQGKIVIYNKDSYMFQTKNLLIPHFISNNFCAGETILKVPIKLEKIKEIKDFKDMISKKITDHIFEPDVIASILEKIDFEFLFGNLLAQGKEELARLMSSMLKDKWYENYQINIDLYSCNEDKESVFIVSINPIMDTDLLLSEYKTAILHMNRIFRSEIPHDNLSFCPLENETSKEIIEVLNIFTLFTKELRETIANGLIGMFEEILKENLNEYAIESQTQNGINVDRNLVTYYKNTVCPDGLAFLTKDIKTGSKFLSYLKKEFGYLPLEIDIESSDYLFTESIRLNFIDNIYRMIYNKEENRIQVN